MNQLNREIESRKIIDALIKEIYEKNHSLTDHLKMAKSKLLDLSESLGFTPVKITGRIKTKKEAVKKLLEVPEDILGGLKGFLAGMDLIGIRIVVANDDQLDVLIKALTPEMIQLKDYVKNPRRDGEFLGGDPNDVYRGYHLFTKQLTGIVVEIQMFTKEMRQSGIQLKRKYGNGYWKLKEYRLRRIKSGDLR